jgi:hypothetical protein
MRCWFEPLILRLGPCDLSLEVVEVSMSCDPGIRPKGEACCRKS